MNLDINDKSRENIARIRLGEARRRLDVATTNNPTNKMRIAEMKTKERTAKKYVTYGKRVDKGAKLAAKGRTIWGNQAKVSLAVGAAGLAGAALTYGLNKSLANLSAQGIVTQGHVELAKAINTIGHMTLGAATAAYSIKKASENNKLRMYYGGKASGGSTIKKVGGEEYQDVLEKRGKASLKSSNSSVSSQKSAPKSNSDNHPANVEASKKYSKGFMDYVKKEAGGFDQIDDPELLTLLELEYEDYTGKKASK